MAIDKKTGLHKSLLNVDLGLQKKIYEEEGIMPPPMVGDLSRDEMLDKYPETYEKDGNIYTKVGNKTKHDTPVRPYYRIQNKAQQSNDPGYVNRIIIGTATTGEIRMEWALARYGQIIPTNWSQIQMIQYMGSFVPVEYQIAEAQNLIVKEVIEKDFEWLFLLEHDVVLPVDAFIRLNAHIRSEANPIISGLYFTKSIPSEPMVYRGRGNSYYSGFKYGDYVWADGVPTGALLIHSSVLKEMWKDSEEYMIQGIKTRKVFSTPRDMYFDPLTGQWNATTGTSDLDWCTKVIEGNYLAKAGWKKHQKMKYPFLVDTNIYCKQIDQQGISYPVDSYSTVALGEQSVDVPLPEIEEAPADLGVAVNDGVGTKEKFGG